MELTLILERMKILAAQQKFNFTSRCIDDVGNIDANYSNLKSLIVCRRKVQAMRVFAIRDS